MERIGARGSGGSLALGLAARRAPGLVLPALRGWVGGCLAAESAQRRLFPWLAVAFGAGILLFFGVADGTPVLAAPLGAAALCLGLTPWLGTRPVILALALALALPAFAPAVFVAPALAATLKPFGQLAEPVVRLSDLFDGVGAADRVIGPAPQPGGRITVEAPQLAAIARQFKFH